MSIVSLIDRLRVYKDDPDVRLGDLPNPAELDDELLEQWHVGDTCLLNVNPVVQEIPEAAERYDQWSRALNAEWERRELLRRRGAGKGWALRSRSGG